MRGAVSHRIFHPVRLHFVDYGLVQVDIQCTAKAYQIKGDVRQFVANRPCCLRVIGDLPGLFFGQPLEYFHQLSHFAGQCHCEILGGMELVPVALVGESLQRCFESGDVDQAGVCIHGISVQAVLREFSGIVVDCEL